MNKYVAVLGRLLLAFLFLAQMFVLIKAISNPGGYEGYQAWLGAHGLPGVFAPLIILIQLIGGALLLLGFKTKVAAIVMAVYTVFLIVFIGAPDVPLLQYMAITGGLLVLAANPIMACSLDNLKK